MTETVLDVLEWVWKIASNEIGVEGFGLQLMKCQEPANHMNLDFAYLKDKL